MRLATVGFGHEANTFAPVKATSASWKAAGILRGEEIRSRYSSSDATLGGFFAYEAEQPDVTLEPLLFAYITPTGVSTAEAFDYLTGQMIESLNAHGPWDGVLLPQHGAAVADGHPDADGEFIRMVRQTLGPGVPIGVTLDMHANISQTMVDHVDVMTLFQTNPHVDAAKQALACARLLGQVVRREVDPKIALSTPPLAINILRQGTNEEPMATLLRTARQQEERPGVLFVGVSEGFPYADVAEMGMSVVAITNSDQDLARDVAERVARTAWAMRDEFVALAPGIDDALREAITASEYPILLLDIGDNVGGGSPGDSTHILHAARRLGVSGLIMSIYDPSAARACASAGVGTPVNIDVGGKSDHKHGLPFSISGEVVGIANGVFDDPTPIHGGARHFDFGLTAGIATVDGYSLAIHSRPGATRSQEQFRVVGIEPTAAKIIVGKGVHSPRPGFESISKRIIWADTPGATSADLSALSYRNRRRPMFPFDHGVGYQHSA